MAAPTVDDHRKRLLALKAELLSEGDDAIVPTKDDDAGISKPDDDAAPLAEMSQVIASSRNRTRTEVLARVVAALVRLEQDPDAFGSCAECDEAIAIRRLALMPYVELCVDCQQARDQPQGPSGRRHLRDFR